MLGEEIIFNFDNLMFLVISIGSWVFVLVGGMPILRGKKVQKKIFISHPPPRPLSYTQLSFLSAVAEMMQDHKSYRIISPTALHLTGTRTSGMFAKCKCGLAS